MHTTMEEGSIKGLNNYGHNYVSRSIKGRSFKVDLYLCSDKIMGWEEFYTGGEVAV